MTLPRFLVALAACLALSACQSPNGVGLGLIDDAGDDPEARTVPVATADTLQTEFSAAGFAQATASGFQPRVLAGTVVDALYGDAESIGYMDALRPSPVPEDFADSTIVAIELQLVRDYVYGDTTATVPLEIRAVQGGWSPTGLPNDTTLATGDVIGTAAPLATDSLIVIEIAQSYVAANDTTFTGSSFGSTFEGFSIATPAGAGPMPGAVLGFDTAESRIVARTSGGDSLVYPISEVFSRITRGAATPPPPGRILLQSTATTGLAATFDVTAFANLPLSRARLKLPLDRTYSGAEGTFLRPLASNADLFVRDAEEERDILATLDIPRDDGDAATATRSDDLTAQVQRVLLGTATVDRYEVLIRPSPLSLDVLPLLIEPSADQSGPRLLLTLVGPPA